MKWSIKIGQYAGVAVYVHATFALLLAWVALSYWLQGHSVAGTIAGLAFVIALFACVLLHEFGHALAARRYGIRTRDITLLPIGGLARLERMPEEPRQELAVALAGPAVNVVIAAALFVVLLLQARLEPLETMGVVRGSFLARLMVVNLFLALFNMIPAFPMDGGRVLRALLATRMEYTRATHAAASVGQAVAFVFGFIGLFTNPFLLFIALFVWIGAAQEASMVQMKSALGGIPVDRAMLTDYQTLEPTHSLARAVELIIAGSQHDFPVVADGRVVGVLTRDDLMVALAKEGSSAGVEGVMRRDFVVVQSGEMLETALARLQTCHCRTLPVTRAGRLAGLITMENIGEFVMIQAALGGTMPSRRELLALGRA